jgi:hypothetical protein
MAHFLLYRTVFPHMPTVASSSLMVSSNPVRMAQFSYQLVTGCVSDIIPLSIRIQRNNRDTDAVRELVTLFMNRLHQARDAYYQSVTIGVLQVMSHRRCLFCLFGADLFSFYRVAMGYL